MLTFGSKMEMTTILNLKMRDHKPTDDIMVAVDTVSDDASVIMYLFGTATTRTAAVPFSLLVANFALLHTFFLQMSYISENMDEREKDTE